MNLHPAKRVAIIIEAPILGRLTDALDKAGATGYTVLPVLAGSGRSGSWSADTHVGNAGGLVQVVCVIQPERLDHIIENAFKLVQRHIGLITVIDCEVIRPERF